MTMLATRHEGGPLRAPIVFSLLILMGMGLLYSLAGTALGRMLFPRQATGSMLVVGGNAVGSSLVAQAFTGARYFHPRPSAARYDPMAAAGSNQARSNPDLRMRIEKATSAVAQRDGIAPDEVPAELTTQSGGGLDPHVSPAGAQVQIARVARARGLAPATVAALVERHVEPPQFGVLGQPRVNILALNLDLDAQHAASAQAARMQATD